MKLSRDRLNTADEAQAAVAAMEVIDRLQTRPPEEQILAACSVFLILCEHYGLPAQDAFTVTKNVINGASKKQIPEFRAVQQYVKEEL